MVTEVDAAFKVVLAGFINASKIKETDAIKHFGDPCNMTRICAINDFMVKNVEVSITTEVGSLLNNGKQLKREIMRLVIPSTVSKDSLAGDKLNNDRIRIAGFLFGIPKNLTIQKS